MMPRSLVPSSARAVRAVAAAVASCATRHWPTCAHVPTSHASAPKGSDDLARAAIEQEWREPLMDTARCAACRAMITIYSLRLP